MQESVVQSSPSSHTASVCWHSPLLHVSCVQSLPSSHEMGWLSHPVFGSQESVVHSSWSSQSTSMF